MKKYLLFSLLILFGGISAHAQDPCLLVNRVIGEVEVYMLDGEYGKALKLLRGCLEDPDTQGCPNLHILKAKISEIESLSSEESTPNGICFTVKGVGFNMITVEGGTFTMGGTYKNEIPTHQVTLSGYYIGETEVTQALWQAVMGNNPSEHKEDNLPVENVGWDDCQEFIRKLNLLTGRNFRLPTEAEWEYAARGGRKSRHTIYAGSNDIWEVAGGYDQIYYVKSKKANELGIYDMSGNVSEWCLDWFGDYSNEPQTNPQGPSTGRYHVKRGGVRANYSPEFCRVSYRYNTLGSDKGRERDGFRLAL